VSKSKKSKQSKKSGKTPPSISFEIQESNKRAIGSLAVSNALKHYMLETSPVIEQAMKRMKFQDDLIDRLNRVYRN